MLKDLKIHLIYLVFGLLAGVFLTLRFQPKVNQPPPLAASHIIESGTKEDKSEKRKIKRVIPQAGGLAPIVEDIEEDVSTKIDQKFVDASLEFKQPNYLLGVSLGYEWDLQKFNYNLIVGKRFYQDIYAIAKIPSTLNLNRAEIGLLGTFK